MTGPLDGVRVVEVASIGPGPFCGMVLADLGAHVTRVERIMAAAPESDPPPDPLQRGRAASIALDLKQPEGVEVLLRMTDLADVLVEGFRPGVMERLGAGPEVCMERNPRLVYGRITGWGQTGPRAHQAGHDIDFIALAGALHPIGPADAPPPPPLNLVADFGGGGLVLAMGVCAALVARERTGRGDVVDAAMADGSALLTTMFHGMRATGAWSDERASNLLDGAAPFYRTYECSDGRFVAVGALEPQFYAALLTGLGLEGQSLPSQFDPAGWPVLTERFGAVFRTRRRDEWSEVFTVLDACVVPVNDLGEAAVDPHMEARSGFVEVAGITQPAPAPRFGSVASVPTPPRAPGADTDAVLIGLGYSETDISVLRSGGTVG